MRAGPTQQPSGASRSSRPGARASRPGSRRPWLGARASRRAFYLAGTLLALAAVALVWQNRGAPADLARISGQNVLLITIDTLRADALGVSGGRSATPALDRVARNGVRFDFAHAHAVVTLPSHASILTGRYPFQHGIRDNSGYRLPPDTTTIATILKKAGYATAAFVAAFPLHSRYGLNQGFDVYDDRFGETRAPTEFVMPERPASTVVPLARGWIANRKADRWFMWVHVFDPHAPYAPPAPFDTQYAGRPYYGEVAATDRALAPLLDDVATSERPTLVVITSDHGEALGDHGEATHGLFAYESTLRIPLIIAALGKPSKSGDHGEVSPAPARHVDLLPTILDAIGEPVPADLPGRTLLPGAERSGSGLRPSYFEAMSAMLNRGWAPLAGAIVNRDKYIDLPIPERYDLSADAGETSNLAGREPERDRTLAAGLRAFGASLHGGQRRTEEPETAARLRALGYVTGNAPVKARYTEADDPKTLAPLDQAIHRGVSLYSERRYAEAAQVYEDIIKRRPDMALAYRHLAFVAWQTGKVGEAIDVLRQAIRNGITHGEVTTQLGTYLAESANPAEAIRLARTCHAGAGAGSRRPERSRHRPGARRPIGRGAANVRADTGAELSERDGARQPRRIGSRPWSAGDGARAFQARGGTRPVIVARAGWIGHRGDEKRRSPRGDRGVDARGAARSDQLRCALQPRDDAGARRSDGCRPSVSRAVRTHGPARVLCEGHPGDSRDSKDTKDTKDTKVKGRPCVFLSVLSILSGF